MPEGHTIHRLATEYARRFAGHPVRLSSPQGKFSDGAALLDQQPLTVAEAHGKHLFLGFLGAPAPSDPSSPSDSSGPADPASANPPGGPGSWAPQSPEPAELSGIPGISELSGPAGSSAPSGPVAGPVAGLTEPEAPEDTVGGWVHIHLGLYGKVTFGDGPAPPPVGQVRLRVHTGDGYADLRGPTRCALVTEAERRAVRDRLGPDPLRADAVPDTAWRRISRSRSAVAALLMDQRIVAGVGNVYRAEVLFRQGIDPYRPGRDLGRGQWDALWADLCALMREGVRLGRIDTVRPEHTPEAMGRPPRVDDHGGEVYVYRRANQPCHLCGAPVSAAELAARNLFWCPGCQGG